MTSNKNRIFYVDITQLAHWQGTVTGIPRVMQELSLRFYEDASVDAKFVSWVKEVQEFCEVDFQKTVIEKDNGIVYLLDKRSSNNQQAVSTQSYIKKAAKKTISLSQKAIKSEKIEKLKTRLYEKKANSFKKVKWQEGDSLLIPWGEWGDRDYIEKVENMHHEKKVKIFQILHDMSPIVVPQFSNSGNATATYPGYCKRIYPLCEVIFSVSKNSKKDAEIWLQENKCKVPEIQVFRLGDNITKTTPKRPSQTNSVVEIKNYILTVGTIEIKKNHHLLYYAYKLAKQQGVQLPKLIVAGRKGWLSEATLEVFTADPDVKSDIIIVLEPSDSELAWLYEHCLFTILPSFYEGWGIPLAESLSYNAPAISSNSSSMVEIAPGIIEHFSPYSAEECLKAIEKMLDPDHYSEIKKKVSTYKPHSWEQSYQQIIKTMTEH